MFNVDKSRRETGGAFFISLRVRPRSAWRIRRGTSDDHRV